MTITTHLSQFEIYIALFALIFIVGILFCKSSIPTSLWLVITGMLVSMIPGVPNITLKPELVLQIFLPLLLYEMSAFASWRDVKTNLRPIALLSIGHVLFITLLVAVIIHALIPSLSWPLCFVLGAVIAPPDDVAIVSIAEKIYLPRRLVTILTGEGMSNDATALIVFRFALAAVISHQFSISHALSSFLLILVGETLYGLALGYIIGEIRLRLQDARLQMLISIITPFLAFLPAEGLGGSGVLATVVTGLLIGYRYLEKFPPEIRIIGTSMWKTLSFLVQSLLFLLVGLELRFVLQHISTIPVASLLLYSCVVIATVIVGRFCWVYGVTYLPRILFPGIKKHSPNPPWQYPFIISWCGMRGGISLAAALAVPFLPATNEISSPRDLLIFLVFCVIIATLIVQGLSLPWLVKKLGIIVTGEQEKHQEHLAELSARLQMVREVLRWLFEYRALVKESEPKMLEELNFHIKEYQSLRNKLKQGLKNHGNTSDHDERHELRETVELLTKIIEIERNILSRLWREQQITQELRNKLLRQLDHRSRHFS